MTDILTFMCFSFCIKVFGAACMFLLVVERFRLQMENLTIFFGIKESDSFLSYLDLKNKSKI